MEVQKPSVRHIIFRTEEKNRDAKIRNQINLEVKLRDKCGNVILRARFYIALGFSILRETIRYLKYGEQALPEAVKIVTRLFLHVGEIELSTEDLFKGQVTKNKLKDVRVVTSLRFVMLRAKSTCMPRRAKITMKRKSRSNSEAIDCIEFNKEATKFDSDLQYLQAVG